DILLPLGKGQRELVVGDRKTGKTSFVLTAIKNHILHKGVVVYASIGKRNIEVEFLQKYFINQGLLSRMIMVSTTSHDSPGLILKAPFGAMTISEYLRDKGED